MASPKKKVTLYFSAGMLDETQHEAIRQDRSISWIIQAAWRIARDEVQRLPGYGARADRAAPTSRRPSVVSKRQSESLERLRASRTTSRTWSPMVPSIGMPVNVPSAPAMAMMPALPASR